VPGEGEVLVAVEAAGLGYVDGLRVRGTYQVKPPLPFIPGGEMAGSVVALGPGAPAVLRGRRVMGFAPGGALAERAVLPAAECIELPEGLDATAAAAGLTDYCTGLFGLIERGRLQASETLLVLGASGGVGQAAIDIGKALGATVVAAASTPEKRAACLARGADLAVDYGRPDWRRGLEEALAGRPLNVIYDPVGGAYSETAFRCLAPGGRHLVVGFTAGEIPRLPLNLPLLKQSAVVGVAWGGLTRGRPEAARPWVARLVAMLAAGQLHPRPGTVVPLEGARTALQALLDRRGTGKPVVVPGAVRR
jgi:NADPH2:quinone reductase